MKFWMMTGFALSYLFVLTPVRAAETSTYTYDAKGRIMKVVRTGSVNNGIAHDKADNRARRKVTGAPQ